MNQSTSPTEEKALVTLSTNNAGDAVLGSPSMPLTGADVKIATNLAHMLEFTSPAYDVLTQTAVLRFLPQRIGQDAALDASVRALTTILRSSPPSWPSPSPSSPSSSSSSSSSEIVNVESLRHYTAAIGALKKNLAKPETAYTPYTLAAINLLDVCSTWLNKNGDTHVAHGIILSHICKELAATGINEQDDLTAQAMLNAKLLLVKNPLPLCLALLTKQQLEEAIFNPALSLASWERKALDATDVRLKRAPKKGGLLLSPWWDECSSGIAVHFLDLDRMARLPVFMRRPHDNIDEIRSHYNLVRTEYPTAKQFGDDVLRPAFRTLAASFANARAQTSFHELECLAAALALTLNHLLRKFSQAADGQVLREERNDYCADVIALGHECKGELPMAAIHIPMALAAGVVTVENESQREELLGLMEVYRDSYAMKNFMRNVANWREAPQRLRDIPWVPKGPGFPVVKDAHGREEKYETCSIM